MANREDILRISGFGCQCTSKFGKATGKMGYPKVYIFLMKKSRMTANPGSTLMNLDLIMQNEYKNPRIGSHTMVGFIMKTKDEKTNKELAEVFPFIISFKIIKENTITGKSGLGDWEKSSRTGIKHNWIQLFSSMIYKI
nr:hypothetical protein [Chryseobacterium sp. PET-29]